MLSVSAVMSTKPVGGQEARAEGFDELFEVLALAGVFL
jgi:hypothetical protein